MIRERTRFEQELRDLAGGQRNASAVERESEFETAAAVSITDLERSEFDNLRKRTGRRVAGGTYKPFTSVEEYAAFRDAYFGGRLGYIAIFALADGEWIANPLIRRKVGQSGDSENRKRALFRWLRFEYRKKGIDTTAKLLALMKAGVTEELRAKLDRLRATFPDLKVGGFVVRPVKNVAVGYVLGTLSEHATGRAFDVTPQKNNPQISKRDWATIEKIAGRTVDRGVGRWASSPAALWQDIYDLNAAYQAEVRRRVEAVRVARSAAGKDPDRPSPLSEVLAGSKFLRSRAIEGALSFFTLKKDFVLAARKEGLKWGATFPTPDLHHFELM